MAVPNLVVVLLCVLGAGAVVTVVAAFGRHYFAKQELEDPPRDWAQRSPEQESYMKRVRDMNQMDLHAQVRADRMQARYSNTTGMTGFTGYNEGVSSYGHGGSSLGMDNSSGYGGYGGHSGHAGVEASPLRYNSAERTGSWAGRAV